MADRIADFLTEGLPGLVVLLFMLMQVRHWEVVLPLRARVRELEESLAFAEAEAAQKVRTP